MQTRPIAITTSALCCLALLTSTPVFAEPDPKQAPPHGDDCGPPHKPPSEAYAACKDLSQGATCSVDHGDHHPDGNGNCAPDREDGSLFCRPNHPPPQAAFDACSEKSAGDSCTITLGEHTLTGACASGPNDKLVCRPNN